MKLRLLVLITVAAVTLSGCSLNLSGKGTLSTSDIVPPQKDSETKTEINTEQNTAANGELNKPDIPEDKPTPDKPETPPTKENKKGAVAYKTYVFKANSVEGIPNPSLITTMTEYEDLLAKMAEYTNKDNMNASSVLADFFLVAIPVKAQSETWEYSIDSVKNADKLSITVLCEKAGEDKGKEINYVLLAAVSKADMPNVPDVTQIEIKHNSYTINK